MVSLKFFLFFFSHFFGVWGKFGGRVEKRNQPGIQLDFFFSNMEKEIEDERNELIDRLTCKTSLPTSNSLFIFFLSFMSNSPNFYIFSPLPPPLARAARHIRTGGKRRLNG
jgi:hypothetical protein